MMSNTFLNYTFKNILELSDLEINVLQVSIDHMVEHLEGLCVNDEDTSPEYMKALNHIPRLEAAKRLKKLFSQGEV